MCSRAPRFARTALLSLALALVAWQSLAGELPGAAETGFLSRAGNNGEAAAAAGNNIYFRLLGGERIAILYVPWPYAAKVSARSIVEIFRQADAMPGSGTYRRGRFGVLEQAAILDIEPYTKLDGHIVFECGALSACSLRPRADHVELIRPGIINEHVTRYDFVASN